ncbi:hypothetical protein BA950_02030 [Erythrobacter sp. SAORIC-644]|nr:hypothetical protein [Sphingomonadaceae bacterium]MAP68101.1 hypothetical protein [Erythrobacteraceae bacterium]MEC7954099.1 hypothetical protein [Pseudomonadota bacterium]PHR04120.1 MAG: hypothetical protein COB31_03690 [Erythrobacter sp.]PNQ77821.1 hypothetical protein BA950_02030 [Erythrobacter sp. SAORIC-644]
MNLVSVPRIWMRSDPSSIRAKVSSRMEKAAQIEMPINRTSATMVTTTVHFAAGLSKPSE